MIKSLKARLDRREDEGFTLIELMVVVLIIAILMAIAIPTFLSARGTANQRAAQSNIRNAATAESTVFASNSTYSNVSATMQANEPALTWNKQASGVAYVTGNNVYLAGDGNQTSEISALGSDGKCYYELLVNGQVGYSQGATSTSGGNTVCPIVSSSAAPTTLAPTVGWFPTWAAASTGGTTGTVSFSTPPGTVVSAT